MRTGEGDAELSGLLPLFCFPFIYTSKQRVLSGTRTPQRPGLNQNLLETRTSSGPEKSSKLDDVGQTRPEGGISFLLPASLQLFPSPPYPLSIVPCCHSGLGATFSSVSHYQSHLIPPPVSGSRLSVHLSLTVVSFPCSAPGSSPIIPPSLSPSPHPAPARLRSCWNQRRLNSN